MARPTFDTLLDLFLLTSAYWVVDVAVRRDGWVGAARRIGLRSHWFSIVLALAPLVLLAPWWSWGLESLGWLRPPIWIVLGMLVWSAATKDFDVAAENPRYGPRLLLVASLLGVYFSPAFVWTTGLLLTMHFQTWEHHAAYPMRVVQAAMAYLLIAELAGPFGFGAPATFVFFVLTMQVSHYFITALAKMLLGRRWYSWVTENQIHHLAASAYSWGWARFLPWSTWRSVVRRVRRFEKPMQASAFSIELLAPLALLDWRLAVGFCVGWSIFHLGVFLLSGLLFWDWVVTNLALATLVLLLPSRVVDGAFGVGSALLGLLFLALFPLRHKLWKPMPLGWFDSPLTQRIHWTVQGQSGASYGLYNDFMCPHERLYGKVHGCFLVPTKVMTYHLGEVFKPDLRDAIRASGPDLEHLDEVRQRFGIHPSSEQLRERHVAYLQRFFARLNAGVRKRVLPHCLRFLKAPGGQLFYWGDLPAYRRQEPVSRVQLHYREEYFDGEELRRLRDECVLEFAVDARAAAHPVNELTPRQVDDFLLEFAAGKLVHLPGYKRQYLQGDDGKIPAG